MRLVSFAVHWIRAEMHEFILRNWRIVKVATTKAQRKLFFNLRKSKKRLGWMNAKEVQAVAKDLGVPVRPTCSRWSRACAVATRRSMPRPIPTTTRGRRRSRIWSTTRADPYQTLEKRQPGRIRSGRAQARLGATRRRARATSSSAAGCGDDDKATLQELADEYGVSAERIRQVEVNAMKKMRALFAA